jgi:nucleoid DNA-binding protein
MGVKGMTTAIEIAEKITTEQNLTKAQAKDAVDAEFKAITDAALSGAETSIPNSASLRSRRRRNAKAEIRRTARKSRLPLRRS